MCLPGVELLITSPTTVKPSQCVSVQCADTVCTLTGALKKYYTVNNVLPDRIIVFRDGVGDGQLETVHEHEVRQLLECFSRVGADYKYDTVTLFILISWPLCTVSVM